MGELGGGDGKWFCRGYYDDIPLLVCSSIEMVNASAATMQGRISQVLWDL